MKKAFTLIELLIVVAIIAILAAIAVPNFLEAQVRATVSRAKADMRSVNTAMETYRIDNNKMVPHGVFNRTGGRLFGPLSTRNVLDPIVLTTPIAYLNSEQATLDPFQRQLYNGAATKAQIDQWVLGRYAYATHTYAQPGNLDANPNVVKVYEEQWGGWRLLGAGPDKAVYNAMIPPEGTIGSRTGSPKIVPYDATNGTVSAGDIVRTGKGELRNSYPAGL